MDHEPMIKAVAAPRRVLAYLLIAAILCFFAYFALSSRIYDSKKEMARQELTLLTALLEQYQKKFGQYPSNQDGLEALKSKGQFLSQDAPLTDPWGSTWHYSVDKAGRATLWSSGPNGIAEGCGRDDICGVLSTPAFPTEH